MLTGLAWQAAKKTEAHSTAENILFMIVNPLKATTIIFLEIYGNEGVVLFSCSSLIISILNSLGVSNLAMSLVPIFLFLTY